MAEKMVKMGVNNKFAAVWKFHCFTYHHCPGWWWLLWYHSLSSWRWKFQQSPLHYRQWHQMPCTRLPWRLGCREEWWISGSGSLECDQQQLQKLQDTADTDNIKRILHTNPAEVYYSGTAGTEGEMLVVTKNTFRGFLIRLKIEPATKYKLWSKLILVITSILPSAPARVACKLALP